MDMQIYENDYNQDRINQENILSDLVVTKYRTASDIASEALKQLIKECTPGKSILELCRYGDKLIVDLTSKVFKKSGIERGIAFPTSINPNNIIENFCPLTNDYILCVDDLVKIELGVHVDGYIATGAHTIIITENRQNPLRGKIADVVCAAYFANEIAARLIKPGNSSKQVRQAISAVAKCFQCQPVQDTASYLMKRYILEGDNIIPNESSIESDDGDFEFEENQVYGINIVISSGAGESRDSVRLETNILQRDVNQLYQLKLRSSRQTLSTVAKNFSVFPFSIRSLSDLVPTSKLGVAECINHGLLVPLPVKEESALDSNGNKVYVAQFKSTVMIMPNGTVVRITGSAEDLGLPFVHSEFEVANSGFADLLKKNIKSVKPELKLVPKGNEMDLN